VRERVRERDRDGERPRPFRRRGGGREGDRERERMGRSDSSTFKIAPSSWPPFIWEAALWAEGESEYSRAALPRFWPAVCKSEFAYESKRMAKKHTTTKERKVEFCYFSIKSENCLEVRLYDVAGQVVDDDDFCVWFFFHIGILHFDVAILQRTR
jgi:hypothetical protein